MTTPASPSPPDFANAARGGRGTPPRAFSIFWTTACFTRYIYLIMCLGRRLFVPMIELRLNIFMLGN